MFCVKISKEKKLSYVEEIGIYDRILKFFDTMNNYNWSLYNWLVYRECTVQVVSTKRAIPNPSHDYILTY